MLQEVKPEWLKEIAPHLIREENLNQVYYNPEKDQMVYKVGLFEY